METKLKEIAQLSIFILLLSACAPTEGYTDQFPEHVTEVIKQFEKSGYACEDPTVDLSWGGWGVDSDYKPDVLYCNKSDSNVYGDRFNIFASEEEAYWFHLQLCQDRPPHGWGVMNLMISPSVSMNDYENLEQANQLANALGYSGAQQVLRSCEFFDLTW